MFWHHLAMEIRDDMKEVIEALRARHSLLASYLEATANFDWKALQKPLPIGKLSDPLRSVPFPNSRGVRDTPGVVSTPISSHAAST